MDLLDEKLVVSRALSALDEAVIEFTDILDSVGIKYVVVSGYVVILTGRSRGTEDIDIILEPVSERETNELVTALRDHGYWGMAMPLDEMYELVSGGDRIRVAEKGELYPNFELWFASNQIERTALENAVTAELGDHQFAISPLELQIAYKLRLAQRSGSSEGKDFEDALHLYLTFVEQLKTAALEQYIETLGVESYYAKLRRA